MRYVVICYLFPAEVLKVVISFQVACLFMTHLLSFMLHFCIKPCWIMIVARNRLIELNLKVVSTRSLSDVHHGCSFPSAILNINLQEHHIWFTPVRIWSRSGLKPYCWQEWTLGLGSHSYLCHVCALLQSEICPESKQKSRAKGSILVLALVHCCSGTEKEFHWLWRHSRLDYVICWQRNYSIH